MKPIPECNRGKTRIMPLSLSDFDAVTFDVYGTLIDWEPAIIEVLRGWATRNALSVPPQDLLMAFDRARAEIQKERPARLYPDVLRACFERICAEFGVAVDGDEREVFAAAPHQWPAYPDCHAGLTALQARAKVGALSNIDNASLESSCRKLDFRFDLVVTAERIGAYKPDFTHFHTAIADLGATGIAPERILHVGQSLRDLPRREFAIGKYEEYPCPDGVHNQVGFRVSSQSFYPCEHSHTEYIIKYENVKRKYASE